MKKQVDYIKELNLELQKLSELDGIFISQSYADDFEPRILENVKIPVMQSAECGVVDLGEWTSTYLRDISYDGKPQRVFSGKYNPFSRPEKVHTGWSRDKGQPTEMVECKLSDEQYAKIAEFEKKHIPDHGPCKTIIGELFRAMQRIEYRAGNDGDCYFTIGTPTFESFLFILSTIDEINFNWLYEKEFTPSTPLLFNWFQDNQIHWDGMLYELEMIKIILIELLEARIITDRKNEVDSRSFTKIND